jgi:3-methyladenine DNA glycosylase/8-oxoguanine DNA glycosylase
VAADDAEHAQVLHGSRSFARVGSDRFDSFQRDVGQAKVAKFVDGEMRGSLRRRKGAMQQGESEEDSSYRGVAKGMTGQSTPPLSQVEARDGIERYSQVIPGHKSLSARVPQAWQREIMRIATGRFDFVKLVHSHGWWMLAPFTWSDADRSLSRPLRLPDGSLKMAHVRVRTRGEISTVIVSGDAAMERRVARGQVRRMLGLDQDVADFYEKCERDPLLRFVAETRCGRLLRAPTAFEDLVKTVCTTNCDWRNTLRMCEKLCGIGEGGFPTAEHLLKYTPSRLAARVPLGYRARTVLEIADLIARGDLPLDVWAAADRFEDARAALKVIWGIGPYALNHMMVLLGDHSHIPVDCEVLRYLRGTHFGGRDVTAEEAVKPYEPFGQHKFLAFKFGRMARKIAGSLA